MDETILTGRGLINDLIRTLTAAAVHMDNLLLNFDKNISEYDDALQADEQLGRALEFLFELRSIYLYNINYSINNKHIRNNINNKTNILNNFLTAINLSVDFIVKYHNKIEIGFIVNNIINAIDMIKPLITKYYNAQSTKLFKVSSAIINDSISCKESTPNKSIMLVEDEKCVREIINYALYNSGYIVINCATGKEAISIFKKYKGQFLLLIVDMRLPDINGFDLCKQFILKKPNTKILFTSGYADKEVVKRIIDFGDCQFLGKPFKLDVLLSIIKTFI